MDPVAFSCLSVGNPIVCCFLGVVNFTEIPLVFLNPVSCIGETATIQYSRVVCADWKRGTKLQTNAVESISSCFSKGGFVVFVGCVYSYLKKI
jgi:hypothetical protein